MNKKRVAQQKKEHNYVSERLSAYLDRQVSNQEYRQIKTHLETCEQCQQELETLLWTKTLLRQVPDMPVPHSFVVREADVAPSRTAPRRTLFAMQWATAVVALLFVIVLFGDAWTSSLMMKSALPPTSEAMLAAPVAMEQSEQKTTETSEVVGIERSEIDQETALETEVAQEAYKDVADVTPSVEGQVRAFVQEDEPHALKLGGGGALTSTVTSEPAAAPVEEAVPSTAATLYPETQLMATPPMPEPEETEAMMAQAEELPTEPSWQQPPEPERGAQESSMRAIWRSVEIGLGVALTGLLVVVILLRRRT